MTNDEVIESLRETIDRLQSRLTELQELQNAPGGPLEERTQRRAQVIAEISALNVELMHLENRKRDRELARTLDQAVPPLSDDRRRAMQDALNKANESIRAVADFQAAIALSSRIVSAAQGANNASVVG